MVQISETIKSADFVVALFEGPKDPFTKGPLLFYEPKASKRDRFCGNAEAVEELRTASAENAEARDILLNKNEALLLENP